MTLACDLPTHLYGFVDRRFLSGGAKDGWEPAVWFALSVPRNRAVGLTVMLEGGAQYRELPPHAWAFEHADVPLWTLVQAQRWNCFGGSAQLLEYGYLREMEAELLDRLGLRGSYLMTLEFADNGYSRFPPQSKSFHFLRLDNGRLAIETNDHLRWNDSSFTVPTADLSWLRRCAPEVWSTEDWPH